jgi:hypothetical protein
MKALILSYGLALICLSCSVAQSTNARNRGAASSVERILILGNSITQHGPAPAIGWKGNWGMAASSPNNDFVHLLEARIKEKKSSAGVMTGNIANTFERKFWAIDTADFTAFKNYHAELIILKIGENIPDSLANSQKLGEHIDSLIKYISSDGDVEVCLVGSFWPKHNTNAQMKLLAEQKNWDYVSLDGLYENRQEYTAIGAYQNPGVAMHPNDAGMKAISEKIWQKINYLFQ